jgi:hypothetical protein
MSIKQSIFEEITIESADRQRVVDITSGSVMIDYYEDIFSPTITAKIRVINAGNTIVGPDSKDGQKQSLYDGLPLRGGERVSIKIAGNRDGNPGLDFSTDPKTYLYVSSITDLISENNKESFTLNLVSREAITNETSRVVKKYPATSSIDQSVNLILNDVLKANKIGTIDQTSNRYGFIGNLRKPFTVLTWLASKSVPYNSGSGSATAGFFFYQTRDGFQFRAIDNLSDKEKNKSKATYTYSEATESYDVDGNKQSNINDFKILNYITERNQNLIEKLRLGTYASNRTFFDPLRHTISTPVYNPNSYQGKTKRLGKEENISLPLVSEGSNQTLADIPSRIITAVYDIGTLDPEVSTKLNSDQAEYQSQILMRYNTLFTQTLSVMIPSNTNLRAGDVIECLFPKIMRGDAREYDYDQKSGLYMIKEVCHHFDTRNSYTSLKLIRDTFGIRK